MHRANAHLPLIAALLCLAGLVGMAYFWAMERVIYTDTSYHLFSITSESGLAIQNNRWGAVATQIIPVLGIRAGISLEQLVHLYSVGFVLYTMVLFVILQFAFRQKELAIGLVAYQFFMATDAYFWPVSELTQGVSLLFVLVGAIRYAQKRNYAGKGWLLIPLLILMSFALGFFHPLMILVVGFAMVYLFLDMPDRRSRVTITLCSTIFVLAYFTREWITDSAHEQASRGHLSKLFAFSPKVLEQMAFQRPLDLLLSDYFLIPLTLVWITYFLASRKKWCKLSLVWISSCCYYLLIALTYSEASYYHTESFLLPLGFFLLLPICLDILPHAKPVWIAIGLLAAFGWRTYGISQHRENFAARLDKERNLLDEWALAGKPKWILEKENPLLDSIRPTWSIPHETWLLSTMEYGETALIVVEEQQGSYAWVQEKKKAYIPTWGIYPFDELPSRYFIFRDTSAGYTYFPGKPE